MCLDAVGIPGLQAGEDVNIKEWLRTTRTITSAPLKTPALHMTVLASGGIISSPGVP